MDGALARTNRPASSLAVRHATIGDAQAIFDFLVPMAHEWAVFPVAPQKAARHIYEFFKAGEGFSLVVFDGETLVGSCGFTLQEGWFFDECFFGDLWFYVAPSARSTRAALLLEKKCREFSDRCGLPIMIPVMHTERVDLKTEFFRRRGWAVMGGVVGYGFAKGGAPS